MLLCFLLFHCCSSFLPVRSWKSCPQSTVPCVCLPFFCNYMAFTLTDCSFHLLFASGETLQGFFVKGQRGALSHLHHLLPIMQNKEALAAVHSKKIYKLNWDSYCGSMTVSLHYNLVFMFLLFWQVFKRMDTSFKWRKYCLKVTRCSCIGYKYVALKWYNFKVKKCQ